MIKCSTPHVEELVELAASSNVEQMHMIGCAQEAQLRDCKVAHGREIDLKDRIIRSTKEDASKWQAIYMSSNKVDIEQFQSFQNLLRSASSPPTKGASSSSNM